MKRGHQILTAFAALFIANAAQAHTFGAHGAGFAAGVAHPFIGLDHLLAMLAVGTWAAQLGGRARWCVPLAFMGMMALGAGLALTGLSAPAVEAGVAGSILVPGLLIAFAARLPLAASMILIGFFAVFHGHTHGSEMPQTASALFYGSGFLISTAALHLAGLGIGGLGRRGLDAGWLRVGGVAIAAAGAWMVAGLP